MLTHLLAAAGVLGLLTVLPGPDMAVVTRRALAGGRRDGLKAALGVVAGLSVWGLLTVLGLSALLAASPTAYAVVKAAGAAYLVLLGVQALRAAGRHKEPVLDGEPDSDRAVRADRRPASRPFATGLLTNLLNPKIAVFYTGLLPALAPPQLPHAAGLATLALLHAGLTLGWLGGYVYLLGRARTVLERVSVRRALDRVTGVALLAFAVRLVTQPQ